MSTRHVLPRAAPSSVGVDATRIADFVRAVDERELGLHSLMVARCGHVVAESWWDPYAPDRLHLGYSLSKSFTSIALAMCVGDGVIGLDDPVITYFPEYDTADLAELWRRVTVRHCITMTVGHEVDAWIVVLVGRSDPAQDWLHHVFGAAPTLEPGTSFTYNQVATYLVARSSPR